MRTVHALVFAISLSITFSAGCLDMGEEQDDDLALVAFQGANGEVKVLCEVADDRTERAQGLMGRTSLPEERGMLFVFDTPEAASFWMKDTYIPLDMVFISEDKSVIAVFECEPGAGVPDGELEIFSSPVPAAWAVEMNQGICRDNGIGPGTPVQISLEGSDL